MPRSLTLLLLVALAAIAFGSTGCGRCGETGTFRDHCDGDTRHFCDGRRAKRQKCGSGSTCREVGPVTFPYTECVDDPLTRCEETVCSEDASKLLSCGDSGYVRTRKCGRDEACTPYEFYARCLKLTDEPCAYPEGACTDDGEQVLLCNPTTETLVEGDRCSIDRGKVCGSSDLGAGCVDESLEPCVEHACAPDGHTRVFCDHDAGFVTHKLDCAPGFCFESDLNGWVYPRCAGS